MATYSGNLVRSWAHAEESANFEPDPRHGVRDEREPYPTTDQVYPDTGAEYAGTSAPVDMAVGEGAVIGTPSRSHDGLGGRRMVYSDDQHGASLTDLHGPDGQRRYTAHKYVEPPLQDAHTVVSDEYRESDPIYGHANNTGAVGPMRGIDGNPQNNPTTHLYPEHGMRPGWGRYGPWQAMARRLGRRAYRYEPQPLVERDHYVPVDQPEITGAGPDLSALKLWPQAGTLTGRVTRPALYREPSAVDASWLASETGAGAGGFDPGVM
jgi:hypothetical protein